LDEKLLGTTYENLKKTNGKYVLLKVFLTARKKAILTGVLEQLITLQGTRFGSSLNHH